MVTLKEVILYVTIILVPSCSSLPISIHNYAPAHAYKSTDYNFHYGVKDPHTGDMKNQWEEKKDNVVRGEYSLVEPDGSTRTVQYTADDKNGFNAIVKYDRYSVHPISKSVGAYSHNSLNLKPSKSGIAYSSYINKIEGLSSLDHSEVQAVVQQENKQPESYSQIQNQAIQYSKPLNEKEQRQNQQVEYIYLPQQEIVPDSQKLQQTELQPQQEQEIQSNYAYELNQKDVQEQDSEQHESQQQEVKKIVENPKEFDDFRQLTPNIQVQLPVKLNDIPEFANKLPVDIDLLNPINIDLTQIVKNKIKNVNGDLESSNEETVKYSTNDFSIQPSQQLTPEEVQKFIDDCNNKLSVPEFETGFVPIVTKPKYVITQPEVPNIYNSHLKAHTTPGLKHYASRGNNKLKRNKYDTLSQGHQHLSPLFYINSVLNDGYRNEHNIFHRSVPNRNQFGRNAKYIRFVN